MPSKWFGSLKARGDIIQAVKTLQCQTKVEETQNYAALNFCHGAPCNTNYMQLYAPGPLAICSCMSWAPQLYAPIHGKPEPWNLSKQQLIRYVLRLRRTGCGSQVKTDQQRHPWTRIRTKRRNPQQNASTAATMSHCLRVQHTASRTRGQ